MEAGRHKLLALVLAMFLVLPFVLSQRVFADGLTQENLPPATFGNRQAALFVKINPPILTSDTQQDTYLQFRLFDVRNNETIKFPTYNIEIRKGVGENSKLLLQDFFQSKNGLLTLKVQPQEGETQVFGNREAFLSALVADPGGTVDIRGPILLEGGLYTIKVGVFGIDFPTNIFKDEDVRTFETALSVGDVSTQKVDFESTTYPITVISYYDKAKDFSFDGNTKTFSWAMPFDWDVKRLQAAANVFVHEEIKVPKSFAGVGDVSAYDAKVNGKPITGRMLAVDPFSSETEQILHFLINKNDILDMAKSVPSGSSEMTFSFAPSADTGDKTSGEIATDTGGVHVKLDWNPGQMSADKEETVGLQFIDAFAGTNITGDVTYDIKVVDSSGKEVYTANDQVAKGGKGEQKMTFPADENYNMEVKVKSIQKEGQTPDTTRNGVARGLVVVPEFPAGAAIAAAGLVGAVIVASRLVRRQK